MKRRVVAVDLGGTTRSTLATPPTRPPPDREVVLALIDVGLRAGPIDEVAFFHGGLPTSDCLEAAQAWPMRVATTPLELDRADAQRLWTGGVRTIELEVGSYDPRVLRAVGAAHGAARVDSMVDALVAMGFRVGIVLTPGLPDSTPESNLADAARATHAQFVRLLPALAFRGSGLADLHARGLWQPLTVQQVVPQLAHMVDLLEERHVEVARIGLQARHDLTGAVVAGPQHPNLRQLVEARRFRARMSSALSGVRRGASATLEVHPSDLGWAKGVNNDNIRALRLRLGLEAITLQCNESLARGSVRRVGPSVDQKGRRVRARG